MALRMGSSVTKGAVTTSFLDSPSPFPCTVKRLLECRKDALAWCRSPSLCLSTHPPTATNKAAKIQPPPFPETHLLVNSVTSLRCYLSHIPPDQEGWLQIMTNWHRCESLTPLSQGRINSERQFMFPSGSAKARLIELYLYLEFSPVLSHFPHSSPPENTSSGNSLYKNPCLRLCI